MVDKGGCKVGKKSDKGGCKIGKKKEEKPKPKKFKVRNPGKPIVVPKPKAKPKPKMEAKPKKKLVLKKKPKTKKEIAQARGYYKIGDDPSWFAPHPASIGNLKGEQRKKAEKALAKKLKEGRTIGDRTITITPPKKKEKPKKKKLVVKPKPKKPKPTMGQSLTGLTKEQMNAMSPLELFGKLPVRVASGIVLNPERTGVKVAQDPRKAYEAFVKEGEAKRKGLAGKVKELTQKYMEEIKAEKLKVPALKERMRKINYGSGYNKGQMIAILAEHRAEKDSGYKEIGDQLFSARSKERGRLSKAQADKVDREIKEARKNPKKPSEKEIDEFRLDMARHSVAMRQMRGPAYAGSRESSEKRLQHRHRNILAYREKHGSQFIDSVMASLGTPRGYEFQ